MIMDILTEDNINLIWNVVLLRNGIVHAVSEIEILSPLECRQGNNKVLGPHSSLMLRAPVVLTRKIYYLSSYQTFRLTISMKYFNKHLKNTKLHSIEFLRTQMTSDPSN